MDIYESADVYSLISVGAIYKCLKSLASVAISVYCEWKANKYSES